MITLVHGSDLHFGKPHDPGAAEDFRAAVRSLAPDALVISGDFTQRAKAHEFEQARAYLDGFGPLPVVVTPGNHDVPLYRIVERLFDPFRNYQAHLGPELDTVTRIPGATLVALNTAAPRRAIVNGRMGQEQVDMARDVFREAPDDDLKVVVAHHHLAPAPDYEGDTPLPGARRILDAFEAMGVDMILGGHLHRAYIGNSLDVYPGQDRDRGIVIVQSGTTTSGRGRAREREKNSFNVIQVDEAELEVTHWMRFAGGFRPFSVHRFPRAPHVWLPLLLLVLLSFLPAPWGGNTLEAQTSSRPEIVSVDFEGNDTFSDLQLRNAIITRQTECRSVLFRWVVPLCPLGVAFAEDPAFYNPRTFRADFVRIATFYRGRGFRQVMVDTIMERPTPSSLAVTFQIQEGEPYRIASLDFEGLADLENRDAVTANLPVQVGDRLDVSALRGVADSVVQRLQNRGYPHAEVLRDVFLPAGTLEGEVLFDVYAGPRAEFGTVEVSGNEQVSEFVIRRMLGFQEGDVYSRERIFDAQRNLYSLEIFRFATIDTVPGFAGEPVVPLQVRVSEGNIRRVRAGGGWNTADCFGGEVRWSSRNFVGGARRLVLRSRLSNILASELEDSICSGAGTGEYARLNGLVAAEFTQPWIFSPRNTLNAAVFLERQSVTDVYIRESLGLNLGLTRVLGRNTPITLSYQPQVGRLDAADVFFCTNFLVCNPDEVEVVASPNVLAPLGIRGARDRTNRPVSPTGGYTLAGEFEVAGAGTLSDFAYQRVVAEVTAFREPLSGLVLAGRLRSGWMFASAFRQLDRGLVGGPNGEEAPRLPPPQKRFYSGGANSVRGYTQNQLGPRVVTVGVEELIFPRNGSDAPICAPQSVADLTCDVGALAQRDFESRPTGGSAVVEGSVELRFPIWAPFLSGAAFLDMGQVWSEAENARLDEVVVTPGFGLRYSTPIGPVRLDLAYRPAARQRLPVVTSSIRPWVEGTDPESLRIQDPVSGDRVDWVFVDALARLDEPVSFSESSGFSWSRVQFQFSIGHAF